MSKIRCQICDGLIRNGRCTWCGMPYKKDEVLYHLNENRDDHYRHATRTARRIMKDSEIPLGDKQAPKRSIRQKAAWNGKEKA